MFVLEVQMFRWCAVPSHILLSSDSNPKLKWETIVDYVAVNREIVKAVKNCGTAQQSEGAVAPLSPNLQPSLLISRLK